MNYQVGDLLLTTGVGNLCVITEIKDDDSYYVMSLKTYCSFRYNKESIDSLFRKVA